MPRLRLLAELTEHGPLRLTELAHRLDASQGPTSAMVEALTREGLVERTVDPQDRRVTRVAVTAGGTRRAQAWLTDYQAVAEELFAALPRSQWPAYSPTVEDSVYVHADHRGEGIGRILLGELVRLAEAHGFHSVMARIVGGHEASIALHAACGFEHAGVEREVGRKFGKWLDVVLMQRLL